MTRRPIDPPPLSPDVLDRIFQQVGQMERLWGAPLLRERWVFPSTPFTGSQGLLECRFIIHLAAAISRYVPNWRLGFAPSLQSDYELL